LTKGFFGEKLAAESTITLAAAGRLARCHYEKRRAAKQLGCFRLRALLILRSSYALLALLPLFWQILATRGTIRALSATDTGVVYDCKFNAFFSIWKTPGRWHA